eukprot:2837412-Rhodomonas_salina.2
MRGIITRTSAQCGAKGAKGEKRPGGDQERGGWAQPTSGGDGERRSGRDQELGDWAHPEHPRALPGNAQSHNNSQPS